MGSFTYLYYHTFVSNQNVNLGHVLQLAIMNLSVPQLLQLIKSLLKYLNREEVLTSEQLLRILIYWKIECYLWHVNLLVHSQKCSISRCFIFLLLYVIIKY